MLTRDVDYDNNLLYVLQRPGDSISYITGIGITGVFYHDDRGLQYDTETPILMWEFKYGDPCKLYKYCDIVYGSIKNMCDDYKNKYNNDLREARFNHYLNVDGGHQYGCDPCYGGNHQQVKKYLFIKRKNL
jgi:hypothetical protein